MNRPIKNHRVAEPAGEARRHVFLAAVLFTLVAFPARSELVQDGGGWIIVNATGDFERFSPKPRGGAWMGS